VVASLLPLPFAVFCKIRAEVGLNPDIEIANIGGTGVSPVLKGKSALTAETAVLLDFCGFRHSLISDLGAMIPQLPMYEKNLQ